MFYFKDGNHKQATIPNTLLLLEMTLRGCLVAQLSYTFIISSKDRKFNPLSAPSPSMMPASVGDMSLFNWQIELDIT